MVRIHARVIWTLISLLTFCSVDGTWAGPPTDHLREGVDQVGKILKDPELAADKRADERRVAIGTAVDKIFDFSETAKRSLGQYWAQRTPAEREKSVRLFTGLFKRTYVSKVDQFNSEMTYRGETVEEDHAVVRTTLLLGKGGEISTRLSDAPSGEPLAGLRPQHRRGQPRGELSGPVQQDHTDLLVRGVGDETQVTPGRIPGTRGGRSRSKAGAVTAVPARQPYPSSLSLTGKLLQHMARVRCARPALTVFLGVVLAALDVGYAEHCLTVEADAARLAGALHDDDLGGELGRVVLSTEGTR